MSRPYWAAAIVLAALTLIASAILYPQLPARIPIHWNLHGEVDGYGARSWAAFLMPGVMFGLLAFFAAMPALSPRNFEVDSFRRTYLKLMVLLTAMLAYLHGLSLVAALEPSLNVGRALVGGIFLAFAGIGNLLGKVRRNFYIGVRVPWTLASDRVWNDTHRLAAWTFTAAGVLGFLLILANGPLPLAFGLLMVAVVVPVVASFVQYKRLERRGEV